jgi:hypothetical protein
MSKYFLIILIPFLSTANTATAQDTVKHANPIISMERNFDTFYDRLDKVIKSKEINRVNRDSSFNWMVGDWAIEAKGFAKNGFRGKKEFRWNEPVVEYLADENHTVYIAFKDSTILTTKSTRKKMVLPPQVILQYDNYGKVWVLQPGYNDRYDWGSLISNGWEGNKIIFKGTISLSGLKVNERETWTRISADEFHILYEENLSDNSWFVIEENTFTKIK